MLGPILHYDDMHGNNVHGNKPNKEMLGMSLKASLNYVYA